MISFLLLLLHSGLPLSHADDFAAYSVPTENITCKKLKFESYFQAQRTEASLKKDNPEVSHPNFAGHYLLLKNEMLLETLWLIADCRTGTFFHTSIEGNAKFTPNSKLVILTPIKSKAKPNEPVTPEYEIWSNEQWMKVVSTTESSVPSDASKPVQAVNVEKSNDALYSNYPAANEAMNCKKIDFSSNFQAERAKDAILRENADLTHPNFAGKYVLIKQTFLFETLWWVVDCATGKFVSPSLSGTANFKPDSRLVVLSSKAQFPSYHVWTASNQWKRLPDPVQKRAEQVTNTVTGADATAFFSVPELTDRYAQKAQYTDLHCEFDHDLTKSCAYSTKGRDLHPVSAHLLSSVGTAVRNWGMQSGNTIVVKEVKCTRPRSDATCEVTTESVPNR